jgi:hypothetical protein
MEKNGLSGTLPNGLTRVGNSGVFLCRKGLLTMKLLDFNQDFPDEKTCRIYFKEIRYRAGVICKSCKKEDHLWLSSKEMFQCKNCGRRMSLRSGTVMENSKLPFRTWFIVVYLMCGTKRNISALEVQRQIGHKYYEPVWALMHKIRRGLGNREDKMSGSREMELAQTVFSVIPERAQLGGRQKEKVAHLPTVSQVVVKSEADFPSQVQNGRKFGMRLNWLQLEAIPLRKDFFPKIEKGRELSGFRSYRKLVKRPTEHVFENRGPSKLHPMVALVLDNAKERFFPTYYGVSDVYLQNYLNEFCFLLNRRQNRGRIFEWVVESMSAHWRMA